MHIRRSAVSSLNLILLVVVSCGRGWQSSAIYQPVNPTQQFHSTLTGLDLLENDDFAPFQGMNVAVVSNHTAVDRRGEHLLDLLIAEEGVTVRVIFGPEHGFYGQAAAGAEIPDVSEDRTGVKIYSLYGQTYKPTPDQLQGIDLVIFDIQDVGARYYTYPSTMSYVMDACARDGIPFWVLDRPNPVRGDIIDGPLLEPEYASFVGLHPVPIRHGLTMGELAIMINEEGWLSEDRRVDLTVVPMLNWTRTMWWDETRLDWIPPSPNIPTPETALAYLGTCLFEGTNISEGRGTYEPFLICGAPWIAGDALAEQLNRWNLAGVEFEGITYTPRSIKGMAEDPKYLDEECGGVRLKILDREVFEPIQTAAVMIHVIRENYPRNFDWRSSIDALWGSDTFRNYIDNGRDIRAHSSTYAHDRDTFYTQREPYLIYSE